MLESERETRAVTTPKLNTGESRELRLALDDRLKALLEIVRQELINSDNESYIELAGQVHDIEDESAADLLSDLNLAIITHHISEIREVEQALIRVRTGVANMCEECGGEIGFERLQVHPTALRCFRCQDIHEKTHASNHHSTF